jgi:hypothetical protein
VLSRSGSGWCCVQVQLAEVRQVEKDLGTRFWIVRADTGRKQELMMKLAEHHKEPIKPWLPRTTFDALARGLEQKPTFVFYNT